MLFTLLDASQLVYRYVDGGSCSTAQIVYDRVNEAQRRLIVKGNWKNTIKRINFYTQNNTISLPLGVEKVIGCNICCTPRRIFTPHYEFLEHGPGTVGCDAYGKDLEDLGPGWPTFFDPPFSDPICRLFAVSTSSDDSGVLLTVRGFNAMSMDTRTGTAAGEQIPIAVWSGGVEGDLDMSAFPTLTTNYYKELKSVYKPVTTGYICLYAYDSASNKMWFLSKYHPSETVPSYRRYKILGASMPPIALDTTGNYYQSVDVEVKMGYTPASDPKDILIIQNLDAIKVMVMAIEYENAGDDDNATKFEGRAFRILDEQLRDHQTIDNSMFQVEAGDWTIGDSINLI